MPEQQKRELETIQEPVALKHLCGGCKDRALWGWEPPLSAANSRLSCDADANSSFTDASRKATDARMDATASDRCSR